MNPNFNIRNPYQPIPNAPTQQNTQQVSSPHVKEAEHPPQKGVPNYLGNFLPSFSLFGNKKAPTEEAPTEEAPTAKNPNQQESKTSFFTYTPPYPKANSDDGTKKTTYGTFSLETSNQKGPSDAGKNSLEIEKWDLITVITERDKLDNLIQRGDKGNSEYYKHLSHLLSQAATNMEQAILTSPTKDTPGYFDESTYFNIASSIYLRCFEQLCKNRNTESVQNVKSLEQQAKAYETAAFSFRQVASLAKPEKSVDLTIEIPSSDSTVKTTEIYNLSQFDFAKKRSINEYYDLIKHIEKSGVKASHPEKIQTQIKLIEDAVANINIQKAKGTASYQNK